MKVLKQDTAAWNADNSPTCSWMCLCSVCGIQPSHILTYFSLSLQHLFLTFPRIVFMLGFVILLTLVLGGYCSFSLYLALTNQTTNEWCKSRRSGGSPHLPSEPQDRPLAYKNIYSKGIWRNLKEIFNPPTVLERKKET